MAKEKKFGPWRLGLSMFVHSIMHAFVLGADIMQWHIMTIGGQTNFT